MAATSLTAVSVQALLHDFYRGPIQETLNQETLMVDLLEKGSFTWAGKQVVIPLHLGRNTGVGYRGLHGSSTGKLPTAGSQVRQNVISKATFLYGRFEIDGPSMASAKKGGKHAFAGALDDEMNRLVDDLRDHSNLMFFVGSECKGLVNEKVAWPVKSAATATVGHTDDPTQQVAHASELWMQYDGDYTAFDGTAIDAVTNASTTAVSNALPETWVRIDLVRLDTYRKTVGDGSNAWGVTIGAGSKGSLFFSDIYKVGLRIKNAAVNDVASAVSPFTTAAVALGAGIAVVLNQTQDTFLTLNFGVVRDVADEPHGILQNLCDDTLFNLLRGDTAADADPANGGKELRATISTNNRTGTNARTALDTDQLQLLIDDVDELSGKVFECWLVNPRTRQTYIASSQVVVVAGAGVGVKMQKQSSTSKAGGMDAGYDHQKLGYAGIPFKSSRHCPRGMFIGFKADVWKLAELSQGDFADLDGSILSRIANSDAWEGFWKWYHQIVCCSPKCNGILYAFEQ